LTPPAFEVNALFVSGGARAPKTRRMLDLLSAWFTAQGGVV
jgi:hypothetical protein